MAGVIAAVLFAVAFVINLSSANVSKAFQPESLMLAGLFFLALHLCGVWNGAPWRRTP
jgi:hypothetical protein